MADYVTPPTIRKKKPDFWGGFAGALAAEVQRRAALKDAMDKLKAESEMALQKSKELATFNQGIGQAEKQDTFDVQQFGQQLTPDVVGAVASPEEQYKYTGVIPSRIQGPPTPEAEATGIGGVIAQMRKRAADYKQNREMTEEDRIREARIAAKDAEAQRIREENLKLREEANERAGRRTEIAETPEQKRRQDIIKEARAKFNEQLANWPKLQYMSGATTPAQLGNSILEANGITDFKFSDPPSITQAPRSTDTGESALGRALNWITGKDKPKPTVTNAPPTLAMPGVPTSEIEAATLLDEGRNPSTTPARREEIKKLLAEYRKRR